MITWRNPTVKLKDGTTSAGKRILNFTIAQSEKNITIGAKAPEHYFGELADQCAGRTIRYGAITDEAEMHENLKNHCLPKEMLDREIPKYGDLLKERRKLMALKISLWFDGLS